VGLIAPGCGIGLALAFIGWAVRKALVDGSGIRPERGVVGTVVAFAPSALLGVCTLALLVLRLLLGAILSNADGHLGAGRS